MYDILKRVHVSTGHGGRDKMLKVLSKKYANVTRDIVELFKSFCSECMKKRKRTAIKGVVVRPILTKDYGSRGQVDLVDMQSMPSGNFKWIMVFQDHLTNSTLKTLAPSASDTAQDAELDASHSQIQKQRKEARQGLTDQAERMVKRSRIEHKSWESRRKRYHSNSHGGQRSRWPTKLDGNNHRPGWKWSLPNCCTRRSIERKIFQQSVRSLCAKTPQWKRCHCTEEVALRTAVQFESNCGGQGFVKCNCNFVRAMAVANQINVNVLRLS